MSVPSRFFSIQGLGTALRTLTVFPWPWEEGEDFSSALPWFPVIGVLLGTLLSVIALLWSFMPFNDWAAAISLVLVASQILLTRALHMDGLADWADSLGGSGLREDKLAIMKDVSLGSFGVLILIMAFTAKFIAFQRLFGSGSLMWLIVIMPISRDMMVELITTRPYGRKEQGMASPFIKNAGTRHRVISHSITFSLCALFGLPAMVLFLISWLLTYLFGTRCEAVYGGVTGDLLGTLNEMLEVALLIVCALCGKELMSITGWTWLL